MIIKQLRQGYTGDKHTSHGPMEGSTELEIMATDERGENFYFLVSVQNGFVNEYLSTQPIYDISSHLFDSDVDFDLELDKLNSIAKLTESYMIPEVVPDISNYDDKYVNLVHLARLAMMECYYKSSSYESGQNFIREYLGKDIDSVDLPEINYDEDVYLDDY